MMTRCFILYWKGGSQEFIHGETIHDAWDKAGYGEAEKNYLWRWRVA